MIAHDMSPLDRPRLLLAADTGPRSAPRRAQVKYGKGAQADVNTLIAGDTLNIRPEIFDEFGNPTVLAEGALQIHHQLPDGNKSMLKYTQQVRGTNTLYDIRHDTALAGDHEVHVMLGETSIQGSPVTFTVSATLTRCPLSHTHPPPPCAAASTITPDSTF